jgi:hypothetical protein
LTPSIATVHRVAAVCGVILLAFAMVAGARYYQAHGGWNLEAGSTELMTIMLVLLGAVLSVSFAWLRPGPRNLSALRQLSIIWSLALLLCLFFTLNVIVVADRWNVSIGTAIDSPLAMEAFEATHPDSFNRYTYRVPTGVFLQSFEFLSAHNVELSGYVWEFYSDDITSTVTRGVVFPESLAEEHGATEAWRIKQNGGEQLGWYFSGVFRQDFDYRLYPFDRQSVWLRVWHPDPDRSVLLVPDFASYSSLAPSSLPGIEKKFVYAGWEPLGSGFSYDLTNYNTHFGLGGQLNGIPYADLYFSLSLERNYLGPLLEHGILEIAIAMLLFTLLVFMAHEAGVQAPEGLSVFEFLASAGGLLFAVILDINAIRDTVESQQLTFLERFPLILAVFIMLVVLGAVSRVQRWRVPRLGYTGGLVPVLAFWPALLGTLLAVTLHVFFYS